MPVLSGSIEQLVASDHRVAVARNGRVLILDEDGRVLAHLDDRGVGGPELRTPSGAESDQRLLDLLDIPEIDRDSDEIIDLVESEKTLRERRLVRSAPTLDFQRPPPVLAASAQAVWVAVAHGLLYMGDDGDVQRIADVGRVQRLSAAAGRAIVDDGTSLVLAGRDGDRLLLDSPGLPIQHLVLATDGTEIAWATSTQLTRVSREGTVTADIDASIVDLSYCGQALVALSSEALHVYSSDGTSVERSHNLRAAKLVCPRAGELWFALGERVHVSSNQGRSWAVVSSPPASRLVPIAATARRIWLATDQGLFALVEGPEGYIGAPARELEPARGPRRLARWLSWLPKISVRGTAAFAPGTHQLEALAFAAFPLNPPSPGNRQIPEEPRVTVLTASTTPTPELPVDRDEACLSAARLKAIELALSEPERAQSYVRRAGRAAWLPELRFLVSRRYGRNESLDLDTSSTALSSPLGIDTVNDIRYEARATWDLARLVFSPEELAAQTQALHMAELRREIESTMNRLYYERRGLVVDGAVGRGDGVRRTIRLHEIEAELDAMSAGAFLSCVSGKTTGAR